MTSKLIACIGQYSHRGLKPSNQDGHGAIVPNERELSTKGIALAIADGISSSEVSHIASRTAVDSFLEDYYCTSDTWTVKNAAQRVLQASNSWLYAQNQRNHGYRLNPDKGFVCTFTSLILKSTTAYLFHVGDAQVSLFSNKGSESKTAKVITQQHRLWSSGNTSYLARALGITQPLEIDYSEIALTLGDVFILATDGVYEHISNDALWAIVEQYSS